MLPLIYADDTNLFHSNDNLDLLCDQANKDLRSVSNWLIANRLTINLAKTKFMLFSKSTPITSNFNISLNNSKLEQINSTTFLGFAIDRNLSWKNHLHIIKGKMARSIGILSKLKKVLNSSTLLNIYTAYVHSYLLNGIIFWGNSPKSHLDPLVKLQKRAIRFVAHASYRCNTASLFKRFNILPLDKLYEYTTAIFMFKVLRKKCPPAIHNLFSRAPESNNRTTRITNMFLTPPFTSSRHENSILVQGPRIFNKIIKVSNADITISLDSFKRKIKNHLLNQI